jgi:hypothetical protein
MFEDEDQLPPAVAKLWATLFVMVVVEPLIVGQFVVLQATVILAYEVPVASVPVVLTVGATVYRAMYRLLG